MGKNKIVKSIQTTAAVESAGTTTPSSAKKGLTSTNAPNMTFQTEQKLSETPSNGGVKLAPQSAEVREVKVPEQVIRTRAAASVLKGQQIGSGVGTTSMGVGVRSGPDYSGRSDTIASDMSRTPYQGNADRPSGRFEKKTDATNKSVNYYVSETVKVEYKESKPLSESRESVQGYNGNYFNDHARTQKTSGYVPAELYFDRSVDEILTDTIYPISGQYVSQSGVTYDDTPAETYDGEAYVPYVTPTQKRGNYIMEDLHVTVSSTGKIVNFYFDETDVSARDQDADVVNMASQSAIIDMNCSEIDRQNIVANAGDESKPGWSPFGWAVKNPSAMTAFLRDIENSTGSETLVAYDKTHACMSYQLNKAAKDGQRVRGPIKEMLSGCCDDKNNLAVYKSEDEQVSAFTKELYTEGAASLWLALYDSPNAFNTKGDVLTRARSVKLAVDIAANNMGVLRTSKQFVSAYQKNEVFSTIDNDYDPFMPVCVSDKVCLEHPYPFSLFINVKNSVDSAKKYRYYFENMRNRYDLTVDHPLLTGIYRWFERNALRIHELLKTSSTDVTNKSITVPITHATTTFSMWSLIVLSAMPEITMVRAGALKDVLEYERNFGYPYSQLISLKDANPTYHDNYLNPSYNEPLIIKRMTPHAAMRWTMPEMMWFVNKTTSGTGVNLKSTMKTVLPWYFSELQFEVTGGQLKLNDKSGVMSMPSIRSGTTMLHLDSLYDIDERQVRLSLDRMIVPPKYKTLKDMLVYKYGAHTDGQPVIDYVYAAGTNQGGPSSVLTIKDMISTPRELGWIIPSPGGYLTQMITAMNAGVPTTRYAASIDSLIEFGCNPYRVRVWRADSDLQNSLFQAGSQFNNIARGSGLKQVWRMILAQRSIPGLEYDFGFLPSIGMTVNSSPAGFSGKDGASQFKPFTLNDGKTQAPSGPTVGSLQKYLWFIFQRMPMVINPFDTVAPALTTSTTDDQGVRFDPFDVAYAQGLAGWRGSDFNEDINNRLKMRLNQGFLYVEDPFVKDSPIL